MYNLKLIQLVLMASNRIQSQVQNMIRTQITLMQHTNMVKCHSNGPKTLQKQNIQEGGFTSRLNV